MVRVIVEFCPIRNPKTQAGYKFTLNGKEVYSGPSDIPYIEFTDDGYLSVLDAADILKGTKGIKKIVCEEFYFENGERVKI